MPGRKHGARTPRPLEKVVQAQAKTYLESRGWRIFRRNVALLRTKDGRPMRVEQAGRSDLYGCTPAGFHAEIEVKRSGERPTGKQIDWLLNMNGRGDNRAVAFWVDNVATLERIAPFIEAGFRIVYDLGNGSAPGEYHLEPDK